MKGKMMPWRDLSENNLPENQELVEVQLVNGSVQLAIFINRIWQIPGISSPLSNLGTAEIKTVIKWRPLTKIKSLSPVNAKKGGLESALPDQIFEQDFNSDCE